MNHSGEMKGPTKPATLYPESERTQSQSHDAAYSDNGSRTVNTNLGIGGKTEVIVVERARTARVDTRE